MTKQGNLHLSSDASLKLRWMYNESEQLIMFHEHPIRCVVNVMNLPLVSINLYFDEDEFCQGSFRTNPAHPILVQTKHALLATEQILNTISNVSEFHNIAEQFRANIHNESNVVEYGIAFDKLCDDVKTFIDADDDEL